MFTLIHSLFHNFCTPGISNTIMFTLIRLLFYYLCTPGISITIMFTLIRLLFYYLCTPGISITIMFTLIRLLFCYLCTLGISNTIMSDLICPLFYFCTLTRANPGLSIVLSLLCPNTKALIPRYQSKMLEKFTLQVKSSQSDDQRNTGTIKFQHFFIPSLSPYSS